MTHTPPETKIVDSFKVSCDGGEGALGHPRVYLLIPAEDGWVECPYCDCKYVHKDFADKLGGGHAA
ncbi:zinc-finger domain-containing protein [Aliiroseovarius sediminis]|uniref:zinc-finger domain-containing protein n=1 Tax=Aliiroseovarius sediminis TaxID=2925839 RepID=UPI001F577443|nr:zinc-finger domain-containing protein [Aliiroseovarius sediminis]MCI2394174.1 zinc-finger domain-containing protein [Aliiroseovarius sediminis]